MAKYNLDKNMQDDEEPEKEPQYLKAFFAGLGTSVIVAVTLALLAMWLETEYLAALCIGAGFVGIAIRAFVPHQSGGGALIGLILCPATYFIYQVILAFNGYAYEKDGESTFWILLFISAVVGVYLGFNNYSDYSDD